jgi:RNA polymerase sigma-70 factor (ECF subfamily)
LAVRRASFRRLALEHLDAVHASASRLCGNPADAQDLVQETYRIAFERWMTLRDPAACRAWLLRILRNAWVDERRRTRRLVPLVSEADDEPAPPSAAPDSLALARISLDRVRSALERLPAESRWLFSLRELDALAYDEIAQILEVPIGTVRSRLARLRAHLLAAVLGAPALQRRREEHER